jgi:hypothetical protein
MKKLILIAFVFSLSMMGYAQSKTTNDLQVRYEDNFSLYFYKNTLRMLNQKENPEFDELIKNIEKLKFLMIDKEANHFGPDAYKKLVKSYQSESYEEIMTSRMDGRNFDIYLNDKKGSTPGTIVLVNDSSSLFILDVIGTIDVSKAGALFSAIDDNSEIGKKIMDFTKHKEKEFKNK